MTLAYVDCTQFVLLGNYPCDVEIGITVSDGKGDLIAARKDMLSRLYE
ncbi:hypothetical protein [Undibacterium sp. SXout20W]